MAESVQLMLVVALRAGIEATLEAALSRFDVACVLLVPEGWRPAAVGDYVDADELPALDAELCRELVGLIQRHDAAALIGNDASVAGETGADGCHLDSDETLEARYQTVRAFLGARAIVGVMPGGTRHMAMSLAEAGADYVGYTVTFGADAEGGAGSLVDERGLDRIGWWAEIFETPVVAFIGAGDGLVLAERAIEAGPPDFLAVALSADGDFAELAAIEALIAARGQLPVPAKGAK